MPTEPDLDDVAIRARFHALGDHLESTLDASLDGPADTLRALPDAALGRHTPRRFLAAAAAIAVLAGAGAGAWFAASSRHHGDRVTTTDTPPVIGPVVGPGEPFPPIPPIHAHCKESAADEARYADGDYGTQAEREADCETVHHDLPVRVVTPDELGPGVVSSLVFLGEGPGDADYKVALWSHGIDPNAVASQSGGSDLLDAYRNIHAAPVTGRDGAQIGWWGGGYGDGQEPFVSLDDLPKAQVEARKTIAMFDRVGMLPNGGSTAAVPAGTDPWPPAPPIHAHCREAPATSAWYDEHGYPSKKVREAHCESMFHDLPLLVMTPSGPGAVSSFLLNTNEAQETYGREVGNIDVPAVRYAYRVLFPVAVTDHTGRRIGWWTGGETSGPESFITDEELPARQAEARQTTEGYVRAQERKGSTPDPVSPSTASTTRPGG
jgi:hypothetical protein